MTLWHCRHVGRCSCRGSSLGRHLAHDRGLARGREQRAVLRPEMHEPVAEAVEHGVHADVGEDPLGRMGAHETERVVEAVARHGPAQRLADAERHVVADDRQRRRGRLEAAGRPHPHRAAAAARDVPSRSSSSARASARRISRRSTMVPTMWGSIWAGRALLGTRDVGAHRPLARPREVAPGPSAASTVKISWPSTRASTRACDEWWPRTTSLTSSSTTAGGRANSRYCAVAQTSGPAGDPLEHLDGGARARTRRTAHPARSTARARRADARRAGRRSSRVRRRPARPERRMLRPAGVGPESEPAAARASGADAVAEGRDAVAVELRGVATGRPESASTIASAGPRTSAPSPTVWSMSVATRRRPLATAVRLEEAADRAASRRGPRRGGRRGCRAADRAGGGCPGRG